MLAVNQSKVRNGLLRALSEEHFAEFAPHLEPIDLPIRHVLVEINQPTPYVCFIESGLASVVATSEEDETIEVGHIGREGITGVHLALMAEQTTNRTFMQVAGSGLLLPSSAFSRVLNENIAVRKLFLRYVQTFGLQLSQSVLANARYSVYERLARSLLMVHDRIDGDDLPLTHEFLGIMLGVRRSGVTEHIHMLEGKRAIKATRGNIRILDRELLLEIAGGCYGIPEREYQRMISNYKTSKTD